MNQKTIILLLVALALMLGVAFMFLMGKEKPAASEKGTATNEENLVSNNENSEDLDFASVVDMTTYEPVLDFSGISPNKKKTDLRTQRVALINFEGEILEEDVDTETLVRISRPSDYDQLVYFIDKNNSYFYHYSYQLNSDKNPLTLVELPYDPGSFQDLEQGYFKDKEGVYYFDRSVFVRSQDGTLSESSKKPSFAFKKLEGIDVNTAHTLSLDIYGGARTINSSLSFSNFIVDDESVFFKASKVARNRDFNFIKWQERDNVFVTNYFRADDRVYCENKERKIVELSTDASSFTPRLIHRGTFYATDAKHLYIDCDVLRDEAGSIVDPAGVSFKPLYSNDENATLRGFFIIGGNNIYFAQGVPFVSGVKNLNSFKLLDGVSTRRTFGYSYFGIDGVVYRVSSFALYYENMSPKEVAKSHNATSPVKLMKTESPIDIETFEVLSTQVTKDKNRVYYLSDDRDYFLGTFVPEDIASFEVFYCNTSGNLYADKHNVYNIDGSKSEGLNADIVEGLHPEADQMGDSAPTPELYKELCGGGLG